ncbi:MAG: sigma-54-dependent Fis family transcriptional regulator [Legionellales bacterium]|nr:sigma-54-dependent Fis family transcriptional regulator [Legionellales bacterium]
MRVTRMTPTIQLMLDELVGDSRVMQELRDTIKRVAESDSSVLILGESGTGKELVASSIHRLSKRNSHPFVPVNCGAIPADLMESELFGHEKGAFTGAINRRQGRFELANRGSLFLDEIGDMPLPMQVKLLRVLQERCFERIGSNKSLVVDVRIIAATHQNLEQAIAENQFREDLFYRLNVFPIYLKPLRERLEDLPLLMNHLIHKLSHQSTAVVEFDQSAIELLQDYAWPGNIRELSNLIEQMSVLYPQQVISKQQIPARYRAKTANNNIASHLSANSPTLPLTFSHKNLKDCLLETELTLIHQALEECGGNVSTAAKYLEIGRTTLIEKMRKHGIRYQCST